MVNLNMSIRSGLLVALAATTISWVLAADRGNIQSISNALVAPSRIVAATVSTESRKSIYLASAPDYASLSVSRKQYCTDSNYLGHYYNNYYGNQDGREFYYFDRDWHSVCEK